MSFSRFVALRYLFSKKKHNAVNIISITSVIGIAVATMAMVIVLSVFNGFEKLTMQLYSAFDPHIKITPSKGKTIKNADELLPILDSISVIKNYSLTLQENVLLRYDNRQEIATIKGVDEQYKHITSIHSAVYDGSYFTNYDSTKIAQAIIGRALSYKLRVGLQQELPLHVYSIINRKRGEKLQSIQAPSEKDLAQDLLYVSGKFALDEEIDANYIIAPLQFVQSLLYKEENAENFISAIEIKLQDDVSQEDAKEIIKEKFGEDFTVQIQYEQKEFAYKILRSEKFIGFLILTLILLIASFNVLSSLSMLVIEKKSDMFILQSMGATPQNLIQVFSLHGIFTLILGAFSGMFLGALVCYLQMEFGFIKLGSEEGAYIIDAYPVVLQMSDLLYIAAAIAIISILTIYLPVRIFIRKSIKSL